MASTLAPASPRSTKSRAAASHSAVRVRSRRSARVRRDGDPVASDFTYSSVSGYTAVYGTRGRSDDGDGHEAAPRARRPGGRDGAHDHQHLDGRPTARAVVRLAGPGRRPTEDVRRVRRGARPGRGEPAAGQG